MELFPFKARRYYQPLAGRIDRLISPPYDVIDKKLRKELGRRNRYNIVHLTLPTGGRRRYRNAADCLDRWCRTGVLRYETIPAIFPAEQRFKIPGMGWKTRMGFYAVLGFGTDPSRYVIPHEATFAGPRRDRNRILSACRADLESILVAYSDPSRRVAKILGNATRKRALVSFKESQGAQCRLWRLEDPDAVESLRRILRRREALIADGHHRFASSWSYWSGEGGRKESMAGPEKRGILAFFCRVEDPGVVSLPTHRVISNLPASRIQRLLPALRRRFRVREYPFHSSREEGTVRQKFLRTLQQSRSGEEHFGLRLGGESRFFLVRSPSSPTGACRTDVELLERQVMEPILGLSSASAGRTSRVAYQRDAGSALDAVGRGEAQAAFLLRSIPPRRILAIARNGHLLPQKSTFFFPKLPSGLLLRRFQD